MAWGKKKRTPWYSPTSYIPSHRTRQKYEKMIRYSACKNLAYASKNAPTIGALLLGMICILLAKRIAHKLHISRLRWQYNYGRRARYVSETLFSPFSAKKGKKKSSRRKSHLKYSQNYQKAEEDKIIPYNNVLGVFAQSKTPPPRKIHQKHQVTPEDKENSENGSLRARRGAEGRRTLQIMQ
ncbi:unnamed protein product [Cylindrotheca closterium]|uniref:Uncharacterized protein n=1 Tax=Cylindrotheca closterium TaxID=2856 RepID=A0AAD2CTZ1_9STRA|nr:unnamed protein product [Cylindrotheca closterium]